MGTAPFKTAFIRLVITVCISFAGNSAATVTTAEALTLDCRHALDALDMATAEGLPKGWSESAADQCNNYVMGVLEVFFLVQKIDLGPDRAICAPPPAKFEPRPLIAKIVALGTDRAEVLRGKRPLMLVIAALSALYTCGG